MSIVCGTDFSQSSAEAEAAAALIAKRMGTDLKLVHVDSARGPELGPSAIRFVGEPAELLASRAKRLQLRHEVAVEAVVLDGAADECLSAYAQEIHARLVVVSSLGARDKQGFLVGSVAEQIVQRSMVPVLVVRDSNRIGDWLQGERPLRVMIGVDMGASSLAALRFAAELRKIAPCDLQIVQVVWPAIEHSRLGVPGPISLEGMSPELEALLDRDLKAWAGEIEGQGDVSFVVTPSWGRCDAHLALLASKSQVDLLVVGTRQKSWAARVWQGSVSHGVFHGAPTNVACVPRSTVDRPTESVAQFHRVLIATDLSELGNHAVASGYGLLQTDGEAHLVYVRLPEDEDALTCDLEEQLRGLVPVGAGGLYISTRVHVVSDNEPSAGIVRLADRLAVDAICLSTHGRSGLSELVLGSQAQEVLRLASKPVLLIKGPRA
ncbi:MAG: universal stress protein [Myxococcales bacterium]